MKKFLISAAIVFVALIACAVLSGVVLYQSGIEKLTRSYPGITGEQVAVPTDPGAVARGRQVAAASRCGECHGEDLSGRLLTNDPVLGTIPASNLTSGKGGIARSYGDGDWIRAIRYEVKPDGRVVPFMTDYSKMSDSDLGDLIAYLKQILPVDAEYPAMRFGPVAPIALGLGFYTPAVEQMDRGMPGATFGNGK